MRSATFVLVAVLSSGLLVSPAPAAELPPAVENGIAYLAAQQQADGSIRSDGDIANPEQATHEALSALAGFERLDAVDALAAISIPADPQQVATEYLARVIQSQRLIGLEISAAVLEEVVARQNADGGFAPFRTHQSTTADTARVLQAVEQSIDGMNHAAAINWLLLAQHGTGEWNSHGVPDEIVTVLSMEALWSYRHQYSLSPSTSLAQQWLLSRRDEAGLWGELERSVFVFRSLAMTLDDKTILQNSKESLEGLQQSNGQWGEGVYVTALALQGLQQVDARPIDEITIRGTVIDTDSGLPLASAVASLTGTAARSMAVDAQGYFEFAFFGAGNQRLDVIAPEYSSVSFNFPVTAGETRDLGVIQLARGVVSPETATVHGVVKDTTTNQPIPGALVEALPEGLQAHTDADGQYSLDNLEPQSTQITISAEGYIPAMTSLDLAAGRIVNLSPVLTPQSTQVAMIHGTLTDAISGMPLQHARALLTVEGGDIEAVTDADGFFRFESVEPGPATIRIEKDAYHSATSSWEVAAATSYDLSTALAPITEDPVDPPQTRIEGVVLASDTAAPVQSVRIVGTSLTQGRTATVFTDADGRFLIDDLHGNVRLTLQRSGFYTQIIESEIPEGVTANIGDIELQNSTFGESALRGRVLNGVSETPIASTQLRISYGTTALNVYSNGNGEFHRPYIPAGDVKVEAIRAGFETREIFATTSAGEILDLGNIYLRPENEEVSGPDLILQSLNTSNVVSDPQSFELTGNASIDIRNIGNATAQGNIEIVAFHDRNADRRFDPLDQALARQQLDTNLAPEDVATITLDISGYGLFRDLPISVAVDSENDIIETRERNNSVSSAGRCGTNDGSMIDLAMCMDTSGSVSFANFQLQTAGTAAAIENPDIIPHDGRVRLSVFRFNSATTVELPPTVISADNAVEVADLVRNIAYAGGGTSIHSCVNVATDRVLAMSPATGYQVIDVSTDGVSSHSAAIAASQRAHELGIDAINALAVGPGAGISLLEDMVFPQPEGGESGFVIAINSYQQYADAIATKVRRETRTADLTAGRAELIDDGATTYVKVRVANSGNRSVPSGVPVSVYAGDPDAGGEELGQIPLPEMGESDYIDLEIPLIRAPLAGQELVVAVDPHHVIDECARSNNRISISVTGVRASLSVTPSAAIYFADSTAEFHTQMVNTGNVAGEFTAHLWLEDLAGTLVADLGTSQNTSLAPGAQSSVVLTWPTGSTLAGHYRVRGELRNAVNERVAEASAIFELHHGDTQQPLAEILITTDKPQYHTTDTASLALLVRNLASNVVIPAAGVRLTLTRSDGQIVDQQLYPLGDLAVGALRELSSQHTWLGETPGMLLAVVELVDATQTVIATASVAVVIEEKLLLSLNGHVLAQYTTIARSEPQTCEWEIRYDGAYASHELPVRLSVVSLEQENVMQSFERTLQLERGVPFSAAEPLDTRNYIEGMAACVLEVQPDNDWIPLADAVFHIDPPPIAINAQMTAADRGRLLVLLDNDCETGAGNSSCNADPYGPDDAPPLDIQRAHLEALLAAAGWRYTIVNTVNDFEQEFRSNAYEVLALFNEQLKLSEALQRDIVADIESGRGLLIAGNHDRRNGRLEEALGIKSLGKNLDVQALVVQPFGAHEGGEFDLAIAQRPNALKLEGAETIGEYRLPPKGNKPPEMEPALTRHQYGEGNGVYAGFDWPVQSATQGDTGAFAVLLTAALDVAHTAPYVPVAGRVFPVRIVLQNEGIAVPGEVHLALPYGASVHEGPADTVVNDNVAIWPFALGEDEQQTFTIWMRLPEIAGPIELDVIVLAGDADKLEEYAHTSLILDVEPDE